MLHRAYRQYIIDEPRQFDTTAFPDSTIWLRRTERSASVFECLFSLDSNVLFRATVMTTIITHAPSCYCCMNDDDSNYDNSDNGDYHSHLYSREIVGQYDEELSMNDIFNILDVNPEFVFALLEILGYNRSLEILTEYSLYKGITFFNPLRQPSLTGCITCMEPLPNRPQTYVCDKEFCNKYFVEYLDSIGIDETLAMIRRVICPGTDTIIYNYLFPLCIARPKKLSKQFIPGLRSHVADYWKFLAGRLLQL
jgi:hypothetical protein